MRDLSRAPFPRTLPLQCFDVIPLLLVQIAMLASSRGSLIQKQIAKVREDTPWNFLIDICGGIGCRVAMHFEIAMTMMYSYRVHTCFFHFFFRSISFVG